MQVKLQVSGAMDMEIQIHRARSIPVEGSLAERACQRHAQHVLRTHPLQRQFRSALSTCFGKYIGQGVLDGFLADRQMPCDLLVAGTGGDQYSNFFFT